MNQVADALRRAEQIIGAKGWTRRRYRNRGRVCMVQAINDACPGGLGNSAAFELRSNCFNAVWGVIGMRALSGWNDEPGRKKGEVRAALLAAADRVEATS